jgi:hypothetical protein
MRGFSIICMVVVLIVSGCSASPKANSPVPTILRGADSDVRERLLAKIPIGTTQSEAQQIMAELGLQSRVEVDSTTSERYLSCRMEDKRDFWVRWVWQIRIDCPEGVVSDISCQQAGIGP